MCVVWVGLLLPLLSAANSGTGGHAYISGFFSEHAAHTEFLDHQVEIGPPRVVKVTLSGVSWSQDCCEQPGLAASLFSSHRDGEEAWDRAFTKQMEQVNASRLSAQVVEFTVFPMLEYSMPERGMHEFISPAPVVLAQFLDSDLHAAVVWKAKHVPVGMIVKRGLTLRGGVFEPRTRGAQKPDLLLWLDEHQFRLTLQHDTWRKDIEQSSALRKALAESLLGVTQSDAGCFARHILQTLSSWEVKRPVERPTHLVVTIPPSPSYACTETLEVAPPTRIHKDLLTSGVEMSHILSRVVNAVFAGFDSRIQRSNLDAYDVKTDTTSTPERQYEL